MKKIQIMLFVLLGFTAQGQNANFTYTVSGLTVDFTNISVLPNGNPDSLFYAWEINGPGEFINGTNRFSANPVYRFLTDGNQYTATLYIQQLIRFGSTPDSVFTNTISTKSAVLNLNTTATFTLSGNVSFGSSPINNGNVFLLKQTPNGFAKVRSFDLANGSFSFTGLANDTFFIWALNFDTSTVELKLALPTYSGNTVLPTQAIPIVVNNADVSNISIQLQTAANTNGQLRITGSLNQNPGSDVSLLLVNNELNNEAQHKRMMSNQNTNLLFENLTAGNYTLYPIINGIPYASQQIELTTNKDIVINLGTTTSAPSISSLDKNIRVFPNPASSYVNFEANEVTIETVSIVSITGQTCFTIHSPTSTQIDISALDKGLYIIQVKTNNGIYQQRLVVN